MSYRFKVSDSLNIPYRGHLLRLKLASGTARAKELGAGTRLRVSGPHGEAGDVSVIGHAAMGGRPTQARLDRTGELDIIIPAEQAQIDGERIDIGWRVGPMNGGR